MVNKASHYLIDICLFVTTSEFKKHKYIETCIHTSPLSIKLTIHVLDKRKIAALWRAEITAMTAWRLFRSKSFWKTRENFQLLHIKSLINW